MELRESQPESLIHFDYLEAQFHHATALRTWGDVALKRHHLGQAIEMYRDAKNAFEQLLMKNPDVPVYEMETARTKFNLAIALLASKQPEAIAEVKHLLDVVQEILDKLDERYPEHPALSEDARELRQKLHTLQQALAPSMTDRRAEDRVHDLSASIARKQTGWRVRPPAVKMVPS
ncbi:MAG: hypothetical protein EA424_11880 [Planctomycetaceae bacterium]|nr:MAG: hypothetical protein EA424_11880 [Planctomycetaceae bacterium]